MRYFSLFSGIGGFELGIGNKATCVGYSDIDKYAIQVYQKHFPNHKNYGDITKINEKEIPDFDLLVGGFPCQAFSIAGKRKGFEDTRGTLFFEIARILRAKQPRLFLLENVKGLLSHDSGKTFATIISTLDELGYDVQWQVLNSKNFGVPQNRERVFIVGHFRGTTRPKVFPLGENGSPLTKKNGYQISQSAISGTLTATDAKMHLDGTYIKQVNNPKHSNDRVYDETGISPTLNTMQGGMRQPKIINTLQLSQQTASLSVRRLTPLEVERLQGFPDGWTEEGLSYIMEVCVNISPALAEQLPQLDIVLNTIRGGNDMVFRLCQNEWSNNASIAIAEPLPVRTALGTINLGRDTVMLFNQKETWNIDELLRPNATYEKAVNQSTSKLWRITLDENLEKEKLSTILTWIQETMTSPTSSFAKIGEGTIGVIIRLNSVVPSYSGGKSLSLKVGNISQVSDTQRYKCCGNAVTVNVIRAIVDKMLY